PSAITVPAAGAATLTLGGTPGSVAAGTAVSVTLPAMDAFNTTATGYTGGVHFTSSDAAATLPSDYTFTGGDNGAHTFTNAYTLKTGRAPTRKTADTVTGSIAGTSSQVTDNPAAPLTRHP